MNQVLFRLVAIAYVLEKFLCDAEQRMLFGTNDGSDNPHEYESDVSAMALPVVLVSRVSAKAQSHVVPFAALWVVTLIVLRVSVPIVLSKVRHIRDFSIAIELCDNSLPSVIKMGVKKQTKQSSNCDDEEDQTMVSNRTTDTKSYCYSDILSTISGSSSSCGESSSNSTSSSSCSSESSSIAMQYLAEGLVKKSVLPDFLRWIEDQPNSSDDSLESVNKRAQDAFKSRGGRKKRSTDTVSHLRSDLVGFSEMRKRDWFNPASILKSVLPGLHRTREEKHEITNSMKESKELDDYKPVLLRPNRMDCAASASSDDSSLEMGLSRCSKSTGLYNNANKGGRKKGASTKQQIRTASEIVDLLAKQ